MQRSSTHATFVIEREYAATPAKVFAAYADPKKKRRWFGGPAAWKSEHTMDFRVGGKETSSGGPPGGVVHKMSGLYWDIVENERITANQAPRARRQAHCVRDSGCAVLWMREYRVETGGCREC
jgi:uncharacterized protein YndB with AHSA1/START domain